MDWQDEEQVKKIDKDDYEAFLELALQSGEETVRLALEEESKQASAN